MTAVMRRQRVHRAITSGLTLMELTAMIAIITVIILLALPWSRWSAETRRITCAGNLKQMGLIFSIYASEAPGNRFPPKAPDSFAPDVATLFPDYMTDFMPLVCPEVGNFDVLDKDNPDGWYHSDGTPQLEKLRLQADASYAYLGFAVPNNAWFVAPIQGKLMGPNTGLFTPNRRLPNGIYVLFDDALANPDQDGDFENHPNSNIVNATLYRIHSGVEKVLTKEGHLAAGGPNDLSRLAVMWDNVIDPLDLVSPAGVFSGDLGFNHEPDGSNVLFLDGHVEFVEYPAGRFPVTIEYASIHYWVNR